MTATATASNLPISIEEQLRQQREQNRRALMPVASNKISTKGKVFTLPSGTSSPGPLQAVILSFIHFNTYYKAAWNPNAPQSPVCWAIGNDVSRLAPSANSTEPQADTCTGCKWDKFGSGNGKSKACKNQYRLILVQPDFTVDDQPMALYVPPSAMKNWSNYVRELDSVYNLSPIQVITEIAFDPNAPYATLTFKVAKPHADIETAMLLQTKGQALLLREPEPQD